jgi:exopolysaccharide production protein ExoQ
MPQWLKRAEWFLGIYVILYFSGCFTSLITGKQFVPATALVEEETSNALLSIVQWVMFSFMLLFSGLRWRDYLSLLTKRKLLWVVVFIAIASILWSQVPDMTFRRSLNLLMTTLTGFYITMRFSIRDQIRLFSWTLMGVVVLNILFSLAFPSAGIETAIHTGAWRGLYGQKNGLGRSMVFCAMIFSLLASSKLRNKLLWWIGLLLSVALVLLSTSKTALSLMILLLILPSFLQYLRLRYNVLLPSLLAAFLTLSVVIVLVVGNQEVIFTSLGRDATLTGRTDIWDAALEQVSNRPLLGFGYKSFWLEEGLQSREIFYRTSWKVPNSHNGYLDLLLDLGGLGLGAFLLSLGMSFVRAIAWLRLHAGPEGLYPLVCLCYIVLYNVTESTLLLDSLSFPWLLYVMVSTSVLTHPIALHRPLPLPSEQGLPSSL